MTDPVKVLSDDEVAEIRAKNQYDGGLIISPEIDALCATVRALRQQITELTAEWCECGHAKTQHGFFSDHDECYECDQMSDDLCCHWRPANRKQ